MIPLLRNEPQMFFSRIAVRLVHTKEHNRAVHFGEKSDSGCMRSKVSTASLQANSAATLLCRLGKTARNSNATQPMR
jgi:glucose-6-phosphate dehydrogenase assembly protein OpcA